MRLLHYNEAGDVTWTEFSAGNIPLYAILSHTWGVGEVSFEDLLNNRAKGKAGYRKILFCGEQAARDHLQYFWVDTCCIDKRNFHELSKAINSMFRWYQNAVKCYVFLSDVSTPSIAVDPLYQNIWETTFRQSRWFTRGWTLQELIAPASVEFFSLQHQRLGDKQSLKQQIFEITGVPFGALLGHPLNKFSVEERMNWAAERRTTEEEDGAYCLLGIFGVFMPLIYGEGRRNAFIRLKEEISKQPKDLDTELMTSERSLTGSQDDRPIEYAQSRPERNPRSDVGLSDDLNILILGETGVGKSTFINALANYLLFEKLDDALDADNLTWRVPCSFSTQIMDRSNPYREIEDKLIQVGSKYSKNDGSKGKSATQQVTVSHITVTSGSTSYTIRLMDTLGIADNHGAEYVKEYTADVLRGASCFDNLHGILILLKSNHTRLTATFQECVKELLTHLCHSATQNIIFGFTSARSSNYSPGDTFNPLRRLLGQYHNMGLILSMNKTYCFDSESFRYLAASKSGVEIPNKGDFDLSWRKSQDEAVRMINYLKSVPPYPAMALITTRRKISQMIKPMVDIFDVIYTTIACCENRIAERRDKRVTGLGNRAYQQLISGLDEQWAEDYVQEAGTIRLAAAKFGLYLRVNSIAPYNDPTIAYLDLLIEYETGKVHRGGRNEKLLERKEELQRYKDTVETLTSLWNSNADSVDFSEEGVEKIIRQLYDLKHFGKNLRELARRQNSH